MNWWKRNFLPMLVLLVVALVVLWVSGVDIWPWH